MKGEFLMHNTLKYLVFIAACGLLAGYTTVQSVSGIRGSSPAVAFADDKGSPIFVIRIPPGYRDWKLISVAHEEGNLNSFAAVLGNDVAIKAYRERKLPFPDGTIIAALHYRHVPSEENNKVFDMRQRSVPRPDRRPCETKFSTGL